jgi:hypothetical protein
MTDDDDDDDDMMMSVAPQSQQTDKAVADSRIFLRFSSLLG